MKQAKANGKTADKDKTWKTKYKNIEFRPIAKAMQPYLIDEKLILSANKEIVYLMLKKCSYKLNAYHRCPIIVFLIQR